MDEFIEMIVKAAITDAMKNGVKPSSKVQTNTGDKPDATAIAKNRAKMNKIMFDAHIEAGFTAEQAIQIVAAIQLIKER